jgi:hypothetical protein
LRGLPRVPQVREGHHLAIDEVEGKGLFVPRVKTLPLVEAGCRDQAATLLEGLAEGARGPDSLGTGVDGGDNFDLLVKWSEMLSGLKSANVVDAMIWELHT